MDNIEQRIIHIMLAEYFDLTPIQYCACLLCLERKTFEEKYLDKMESRQALKSWVELKRVECGAHEG